MENGRLPQVLLLLLVVVRRGGGAVVEVIMIILVVVGGGQVVATNNMYLSFSHSGSSAISMEGAHSLLMLSVRIIHVTLSLFIYRFIYVGFYVSFHLCMHEIHVCVCVCKCQITGTAHSSSPGCIMTAPSRTPLWSMIGKPHTPKTTVSHVGYM